ncbi:hypothetical protein [Caulobacter sp. DWP3-1-3b2]|uniref:hypothetical protein n=1 Tax=Caulobacter sp. DWP3-1-3b2 TaxID=2804643 RepID=UPI003CEE6B80
MLQPVDDGPQPKPVRGTTIPADWAPSPIDWEYAAGKGMGPDRITRAAERFTNFWRAKTGASARKRDWAATWRNWILDDLDRHPPPKARLKQAVW